MANHRKHPLVYTDAVMALIIEAARKGERCPIASHAFPSHLTSQLAKARRIRIDIYPHNWRVITITSGQHAGLATQGPPDTNWRPYKTIPESKPSAP